MGLKKDTVPVKLYSAYDHGDCSWIVEDVSFAALQGEIADYIETNDMDEEGCEEIKIYEESCTLKVEIQKFKVTIEKK